MKIKFVETLLEWEIYHKLRETLLFQAYGRTEYDRNHPSLTAENHYHFVMYDGEKIVTIAMLQILDDGRAALRALATDPDFQMRGYGAKAMVYLENWAKEQGCTLMIMHAARPAVGFYRRVGYKDMNFSEDRSINVDIIDLGKELI